MMAEVAARLVQGPAADLPHSQPLDRTEASASRLILAYPLLPLPTKSSQVSRSE
jgi:hypothetical protein